MLTMTTSVRQPASGAPIDVAAEVRAEMARTKLRTNHLPRLLGKSQSYWSRRINGDIPLDSSDLLALADLLRVHPARFFGVEGHPALTTERPDDAANSGWKYRGPFRRHTDRPLHKQQRRLALVS